MFDLTIQDRTVPSDWDFDASARKAHKLVGNWRKVTAEMLRELWLAREVLSKEGRPKTGSHSWASWCERAGLAKSTANRWLTAYDPKTGSKREKLVEKSDPSEPVFEPEELAQSESEPVSQPGLVLVHPSVSEDELSGVVPDTVPDTVPGILSRVLDGLPTLANLPPVQESEKEQVRSLAKKIQNRCSRILNTLGGSMSEHEKQLLDDVFAAFRGQQEDPADFDFRRETRPAKELVARAMAREGDDGEFLRHFLETYHSLTNGQDKFWSQQPFLPSAAVSMYPRVLKQMSNEHSKQVTPEMLEKAMAIWK